MTLKENRNYWLVAALFVVTKLLAHLFTNTQFELHRDEMLYFNMSDYPAFGYASVPPVIGFLALIVKGTFGFSVFGIRLIPALLGAASVFIMAKIIKELGGGVPALVIASVSFLLSPGFLIFDTLFTPNVVEQFLWLLIIYFIFRMTNTNNPKYWITIGILIGVAFMNKYSVLFLFVGFFVSLLFSKYRKLLSSRYLFFAIVAGFVIFLPNILWQYWHNWPVFHHMEELNKTQMVNMRFGNFLLDLFSLNLLVSIIWIIGLISALVFKDEKKYRYIGIATLIIIVFFVISKGKAYYLMGLFPFMMAFGAYTLEKYLTEKKRVITYILISLIAISGLIVLPFSLPVLSFQSLEKYAERTGNLKIYPFYRWEDGKVHPVSQVYADMTGWKEMTANVSKAWQMLSDEEKKTCTIFAEENYGYAGAVHFYGKEYDLKDAITFHDSYTLWAPDSVPNGTFIYINTKLEDIKELFADITKVGSVNNKYFRENGLSVYICRSPKTDVSNIYKQLAIKYKSLYHK